MKEDFITYSAHYHSMYDNVVDSSRIDAGERHNASLSSPHDDLLRERALMSRSPVEIQELTEAKRYQIIACALDDYVADTINDPEIVVELVRQQLQAYFDSCTPGTYTETIVEDSVRELESVLFFRDRNAYMSMAKDDQYRSKLR